MGVRIDVQMGFGVVFKANTIPAIFEGEGDAEDWCEGALCSDDHPRVRVGFAYISGDALIFVDSKRVKGGDILSGKGYCEGVVAQKKVYTSQQITQARAEVSAALIALGCPNEEPATWYAVATSG